MTEPSNNTTAGVQELGNSKRPIGAINLETQKLVERLMECRVGDFVSYEELGRVAGLNVLKNRGPLYTARKRLRDDFDQVFVCIPREGIKCGSVDDKLAQATKRLNAARSQHHLGLRELATAKDSQMTSDQRLRHSALSSLHLMGQVVATEKQVSKLTAMIEQSGKLDLTQTLRFFAGDNGNR